MLIPACVCENGGCQQGWWCQCDTVTAVCVCVCVFESSFQAETHQSWVFVPKGWSLSCHVHVCIYVQEGDRDIITAEPTNGMSSVLGGFLASSSCAVNEQVLLFNEGEALLPLTDVIRAAGRAGLQP